MKENTCSCKLETLEQVAIKNGPDALSQIKFLLDYGNNPLEPNAKKLFPFHYARTK